MAAARGTLDGRSTYFVFVPSRKVRDIMTQASQSPLRVCALPGLVWAVTGASTPSLGAVCGCGDGSRWVCL